MNNIKIKYKDLLSSWRVIEKILKLEAPFKLQYWLNKNISSISKTISELEKERITLFSQYKEKLEDKEFKEKMDELLGEEIEICIEPIEIKLLESIYLTGIEMRLIQYMTCENKIIKTFNS